MELPVREYLIMLGDLKIGRNDPCPCGSGRKYKHCCLGGSIGDRTAASERFGANQALSLDERNDILLRAVVDIFKLDKRDWDDIRREISDDKVRQLYKVMASVWPPNTAIETAFPQPDARLRALYLGLADPDMILENLVRYSLYCDEILIVNPLLNPWNLREEYDPIRNPAQYKADVLKLIAFIDMLAPWMKARIVRLIPDPSDLAPGLRPRLWALAEERVRKQGGPDPEAFEELAPIFTQEMARTLWRTPDRYLAQQAKEAIPGITDAQTTELLAHVAEIRSKDPLGLPDQYQGAGSEMHAFRLTNLETGMFICQTTGAFPYTNLRFRWKELLAVAGDLPNEAPLWTPLTRAFQALEFQFLNHVDTKFAASLHRDGRLEQFRAFLRRLWRSINDTTDPPKIDATARQFSDELNDQYRKAQAEWSRIGQDLLKWVAVGAAGATGAGLVTGHMIAGIPAAGFAISGVVTLLNAHLKRRSFRQSVPMSVFIDLLRRH